MARVILSDAAAIVTRNGVRAGAVRGKWRHTPGVGEAAAMDDTGFLPTRHRLDVEAYYRMAEAGILGPDDRVELIGGEIIDMAPIGQDHAATVNALTRAIVLACGGRAIVSVRNSVRLDRFNAPQPDVALLRPRADFYRTGAPPGPADVLLAIEVADSTLRHDRMVKLPLYARSGIVEVWLVDLRQRVLEAHRAPGPEGYTAVAAYQPGETVTLTGDAEIAVALRRVFD